MGNEQSVNIEELSKNGTIPEKHENGTVNGISIEVTSGGLEINGKSETTVCQNGKAHSLNSAIQSTDVIGKSECQPDIVQDVSEAPDAKIQAVSEAPDAKIQAVSEVPDTNTQKEEVKKSKGEKGRHHFGKLFKKKSEPKAEAETVEEKEKETQREDQTDVSVPPTEPQQETANLNQEPESLKEPERVTPVSSPKEENVPETDNGDSEAVESKEESNPEENPVMNFFKTLVTPTKTSKKETAIPDAAKDKSQKETQPAATTTVAQISEPPAAPKGMSVPPPPPPEPPKMEIKGEPTAKPVKASAKEEPKAAEKEPVSSKGKSAKDTLSKLFRQKETPVEVPAPVVEVQIQNEVEPQEAAAVGEEPVVEVQIKEEVPQPVVETEKVDSSKADTREAAAKPEPPPPAQEEKKSASKSPFLSFFKPQAAEPKKVTPTPPAAAEAAQAVKAKEEPKVAAKSSEQAADNKPASVPSQAGDDAASVPKKLEKRNSIQLFFKNLTQKRPSTDAGVQTEPLTAAQGAEKAK